MDMVKKAQVDHLEKQMQQAIASLRQLQLQDHSILQARKRAKAIEQIEDLRSELHLLQMELEQGETEAEAMTRTLP